ncbi:MAG: TonB-dependent receptor [Burkholderiaceae bacterium]|jgi:iron complex outermembrane recepter protein|uniref:TonB-dependent receptor n=1 Tax=Cupriavidus metallidurans TaxID=119219 RepID=A0A482IFM9_9BURK|nr:MULTISPECIES: TonB-dependent receptor [Cupriavidus]KWR80493.1 TonB-dependent receptor [Cupriavidus sp. SHE]PCH55874.1 MAG: TonB-dependent receptor [Burkholderiaceae bacterium]QBP08345.1 TonB-dependent receptor [Cupriavidus metallidurans]QWC88745.1 TonB-dependent receptor [Cupriavidus metallidurans]
MFSNNTRIPAVRRTPLAALAALIVTSGVASHAMAQAQDNAAAAAAPAAPQTQPQPQTLKEVVVTANPLGSDLNEMVAPVSTLGGDALTVRQTSTLGETLNGMPGVTSTYFGPNASRPSIRGLDGDRIKLLQSGGSTLDASSLSYDHAVPIDPLVAEKVEVVRGPAALMYGGNALGGVVNVIDNRIPRDPVTGVSGAADVSGTIGGDKGRNASGLLEAGNGTFAVHADAFVRQTSDLRIPGFARSANLRATQPLPAGESEAYGTLPNTSSHQEGGSMGGSYTWADGFLGANYSTYRNDYGTPAEADARIKMRQDRIGLAGEARNLAGNTNGIIESVKGSFNYTDYEHRELENGVTGTTFKNRGWDTRIEATHGKIGNMSGVIGTQFGHSDFSALGEEAFVPSTTTDNAALFVFEELPLISSGDLKLNLGGRIDHSSVKASANGNDRFTDDNRSFNAGSASAGLLYKLNPIWTVTSNLSYTERAPTFYELYANGPHLATNAYEIGDPNANKERATSIDLGMRFKQGDHSGSVSGYYSRFQNYLALLNTGTFRDAEGNVVTAGSDGALPVLQYAGVPATLYGFEAEGKTRLLQKMLTTGDTLDFEARADYVHGENRNNGEPLPRLAPLRLGGSLVYAAGPWGARINVDWNARQTRVPTGDTPTDAYTMLGVSLTYKLKVSGTQTLLYLRGDNLTNTEARSATSILRDIAPLPGRSVKIGMRTMF